MQHKKKILVISDDSISRTTLYNILSSDYFITEATNELEGIRLLKSEETKPDLIILDIAIPVIGDFIFLSEQKRNSKLAKIPVIATIEKIDDDTELEALNNGAVDVISKPFNSKIILARIKNIIALRESTSLVEEMERDTATGLLTYQAFINKLDTFLDSERLNVAALDFSAIKCVGHLLGEKAKLSLMQKIGLVLIRFDLSINSISCRSEEDNFYFAFPNEHRPEDIAEILNEEIKNIESNIPISLNIGFCLYGNDLNGKSMCYRARMAAESTKNNPHGAFSIYTDELDMELINDQEIILSARSAFEEKQFLSYFQPTYNLSNGELMGADAFSRWIHPVRGLMKAKSYLSLFEKNDLIKEHDLYIFEQVCLLLKCWIDKKIKIVPISVSISTANLISSSFKNEMMSIVEKYNIPTEFVHLIFSEDAFTTENTLLTQKVKQLHLSGFHIKFNSTNSLFSPINAGEPLPIDEMRLTVHSLNKNNIKENFSIPIQFVNILKMFDFSVCGTEIKNRSEYILMKDLGCNSGQGHYFSHPMPAEQFEDELQKNKKFTFQ